MADPGRSSHKASIASGSTSGSEPAAAAGRASQAARTPSGRAFAGWGWVVALGVAASTSGCRDSLLGRPDEVVGTPEAAGGKTPHVLPQAAAATPAVATAPATPSAAATPGPGTPASPLSPPLPPESAPVPDDGPRLVAGGAGSARGPYGMVVSVELNATQVGVRMLEMGGNAVDAAVATAYALAVTHPSAGNLGGGGFMLIARRGQPIVSIDFRERAPAATTVSAFLRMLQGSAKGPAASAVPGTVAGLNLAQQRFGLLPLEHVVLPAVELARRGHRIGARQAEVLAQAWHDLSRDRDARRIFGSGDEPLSETDTLVQRDLADTLEAIARQGDAGFYSGTTARRIEAAMGKTGLIRREDLSEYRAVLREPLRFGYHGFEVVTMPPPSSGGLAVAQITSLLEQLGAERLTPGSADELHLFIEASKRAQARRRYELVDPDADPAAMSASALAERLTPQALLALSPPIDPGRASPAPEVYVPERGLPPELPHTTHLSVVDAQGNAVSCTVTLSSGFGARYVVAGTGMLMNNSLAAFGGAGRNLPQPGRRMLSSMSPTLVLRAGGEVAAVLGSPGGDTIPSTVAQVLRHLVEHRMSIDQAVEAPRLHHGFTPDQVRVESSRPFDPAVLAELEARGHRIVASSTPMGDANNIVVVDGVAYGRADSREGGLALGPLRLTSSMLQPLPR
jgi:gamma-glutamyltranspeptidase/glutathione hydrolase